MLNKGIVFLIFMLAFVNIGAIVRLVIFNSISWKQLKFILIFANIIVIVFYVVYYIVLKR